MKALSSINLSYGLLNIPIKVYPLRDSKSDSISFSSLSDCCKKETGLKRYCKNCLMALAWKTDLKGYKIGKEFIELSKAELETIERLDNGIEIIYFIKNASLLSALLDKPYFLEPTANFKLYSLFNSLFAQQNISAICRFVMKGNEHFGVLRHDKNGLLLQIIEKITDLTIEYKKADYSEAESKQLKEIIESNIKDFDFSLLKNLYVEKVKRLIEAKSEGKTIDITATTTERLEEANLLDTLKAMSKQKIVKEVD